LSKFETSVSRDQSLSIERIGQRPMCAFIAMSERDVRPSFRRRHLVAITTQRLGESILCVRFTMNEMHGKPPIGRAAHRVDPAVQLAPVRVSTIPIQDLDAGAQRNVLAVNL
jgi:hypothetical protein